jgi:hypothetical protein
MEFSFVLVSGSVLQGSAVFARSGSRLGVGRTRQRATVAGGVVASPLRNEQQSETKTRYRPEPTIL